MIRSLTSARRRACRGSQSRMPAGTGWDKRLSMEDAGGTDRPVELGRTGENLARKAAHPIRHHAVWRAARWFVNGHWAVRPTWRHPEAGVTCHAPAQNEVRDHA